jgi:flagellar basal-body rod protein FlgC
MSGETNFFSSLDITASAMTAERFRMDIISQNIANANTENTVNGTPYRRMVAVINSSEASQFALPAGLDEDDEDGNVATHYHGSGVKATDVVQDMTDFRYVYDPTNPNSIKRGKMKGYVAMPNVNLINEMTDLMGSTRAFDACATAADAAKSIAMKGLEIGQH